MPGVGDVALQRDPSRGEAALQASDRRKSEGGEAVSCENAIELQAKTILEVVGHSERLERGTSSLEQKNEKPIPN